jgi:hypothetical protein
MVDNTEKQMVSEQRQLQALIDMLLNHPDGLDAALMEIARAEMQRRRERIARNNAKYDRLLTQMTDKQANKISQLESNGYKINQVFYKKNDVRGNIAVMLVKEQVWNDEKGKIGRKLVVMYADGTQDSTFDRAIAMRKVF